MDATSYASHLIALAASWERCAEDDPLSAAMYRRHAAQVREIVAASGVVQL